MDVHRKPMPQLYQQQPSPTFQQHSRNRTTSSNVFPEQLYPQQQTYLYANNMPGQSYTSRRSPSTNTFSTIASSGNGPVPFRQSSGSMQSEDLQRSGSSRSGGTIQPSSYVALMRKQKATVWCDRAQHEDPRILAAQRAAKKRAAMEVVGRIGGARTSTSGSGSLAGSNRVTAKIRHHGKAGLVGYSPGDLVGGVGGVPMRLSASEVEGGDSEDDGDSTRQAGYYHQRSGSGRSSVGSGGRRGLTYSRQSGASSTGGRWSAGHTPPDTEPSSGVEDTTETPVPASHTRNNKDYFDGESGTQGSMGSGSSGEGADAVADLSAAKLASNSLLRSATGTVKSLRNGGVDLMRRGSVDDRTMTLSAGRLYIANPDEDSD